MGKGNRSAAIRFHHFLITGRGAGVFRYAPAATNELEAQERDEVKVSWIHARILRVVRYFHVTVVSCVITHRHFPSRLTNTSVALSRVLSSLFIYLALLEVSAVKMAVVP